MEFLNSDMSWYSNGKTDDFTKVNKRIEWTNEYACNFYGGLPFPSPVDHVLSEPFTMIRPSWVALHSMAHSFIESGKAVDHKEGWTPKDWYFWAVVLEKTLESPLDCKETKPVNPKGNQSWMFIGRTDAEAEASILWPPDAKSQFIRKDSDTGKDWRREEKGMTEDEMVGWHHRLHEHEFEQALGDSGRPRNLVWCSPWGHKQSDTT